MKNFAWKSFPDADVLARAAARDWLGLLENAAQLRGAKAGDRVKLNLPVNSNAGQRVALSGGRVVKTFFRAVAESARASGLSLQNVDFFWADERCVPPDHPDSNYLLAKENLFDLLNIAPDKIHRLKGELPQDAAVVEANAAIERIAPKNSAGQPVLDLVFLGVGEDGHVASLMPNLPPAAAATQASYLKINNSPKPPPDRLSLSYAAIAAAKEVWVLVPAAGKEKALRESLQPGATTPLGRVLQSRPMTVIYSDIAL